MVLGSNKGFSLHPVSTMSTRSGRNYISPPVSPTPRVRKSQRSTPLNSPPAGPYRRQNSSSTEEGSKGEDSSVASLVPSVAESNTTPGSRKKGRPFGSNSKTRSNSAGLSDPHQKQLACDLEDWGGFDRVDSVTHGFTQFCNEQSSKDEERSYLYGEVSSKQRDRIRHKLEHWRKSQAKDGGYYDLLQSWGIVPAQFRNTANPVSSQPQPTKPAPTTSEPKHQTKPKGVKKKTSSAKEVPVPSVVSTDISTVLESLSLFEDELKMTDADDKSKLPMLPQK
jgi:hypothetical protein